MKQLQKQELGLLNPFFAGWEETILWSGLQGHMGHAWVDDGNSPTSARVLVGDFCFLAGRPDLTLIERIDLPISQKFLLLIPRTADWEELIQQVYAGRYQKLTRYAIKKQPDVFDPPKLKAFANSLSGEFELLPINRELYDAAKREAWSADLCSQFSSWAEYERNGLGFAVLHGNELVCGASSYSFYDGGIEIEIDTRKDYRRKGLAQACAARLILECLDRKIYPSWDAANLESVSLAEKLGYHFDHPYRAYEVEFYTACSMQAKDV